MRPFSLIFWAILLLISGAVLLIRQFSPLDFNVFRVIIGVFVLLLGVSLLTGSSSWGKPSALGSRNFSAFSQDTVHLSGSHAEHNRVFGQSDVDLTDMLPGSSVEINVVFGQCRVLLPADRAIKVESNAVFGQASGPNGANRVNFGDRTYTLEGEGAPIQLEVNAVFGQIDLVR
jgi:predicted membrane protein